MTTESHGGEAVLASLYAKQREDDPPGLVRLGWTEGTEQRREYRLLEDEATDAVVIDEEAPPPKPISSSSEAAQVKGSPRCWSRRTPRASRSRR